MACVVLLQHVASCQTPGDNQVARRLHSYLSPFAETGNFTGAVLVVRNGRVLLRQSYGMANYELMCRTRLKPASILLQSQSRSRQRLSCNCRSREGSVYPTRSRVISRTFHTAIGSRSITC